MKRDLKYLDELIAMKCGPDLLASGIYPNAKEVTESFGAYHAVRKHMPEFELDDPDVTCVCVGDGCTPRTAAAFAFRSLWRCISVDPALKLTLPHIRGRRIDRLECYSTRIEEMRFPFLPKVVIVAVHSHANLANAVKAVLSGVASWGARGCRLGVVAIPCCVKQDLHVPPDLEYRDPRIASEKNLVRIWKDVQP